MERRAFLRHIITAAALCPVCSSLARAEDHAAPHWGYEGHGGPDEWANLSPDYAVCGKGREQSPVDLQQPIAAHLAPPAVSWQPMPLEVINNGHTIQVNCAPGSSMVLDGVTYQLLQYHFHHPSEHRIAGQSFDMEVHFVHRSAEGGLAVLGVMISKGAANSSIETIWNNLPAKAGEKVVADVKLQPSAMLPEDSASYRYAGSLTTPPCSEVVSWVVFRQGITASEAQIAKFAEMFPNNARPPQPLNRRKLLMDLL